MRLCSTLFLLALAAAACGDGAASSSGTVMDTSGDTIVARAPSPEGETERRLVPELTIGVAEGAEEYTFGGIGDIAIGANGEIYVWDYEARELRAYDSTGTFVRRIGRTGAGPGEYDRVNGIAVRPDGRLVVWDAGNGRVNVYRPGGDYETTWRLTTGFFTQRAVLTDTANNTYLRATVARDSTRVIGIMGYLRIPPDGVSRDSLVPPEFGGPPPQLVAQIEGGRSSMNIPFLPVAQWAMSPHGYFVAGPGDPYVVHLLRTHDKPIRIEREVRGPAVDPVEREESRTIALWSLRRTQPGYQWNGPDIPDRKPAYSALTVDLDGRVWVTIPEASEKIPAEELPPASERSADSPPPRTWRAGVLYDVYAPGGEYLGRVRPPRRITPHEMRGDHMWAVTFDSLDIPAVTRFRIEPGLGRR